MPDELPYPSEKQIDFMGIMVPQPRCQVCGEYFKQITPNHTRSKHSMPMYEYNRKFPNAPTFREVPEDMREELYSQIKDTQSECSYCYGSYSLNGADIKYYQKLGIPQIMFCRMCVSGGTGWTHALQTSRHKEYANLPQGKKLYQLIRQVCELAGYVPGFKEFINVVFWEELIKKDYRKGVKLRNQLPTQDSSSSFYMNYLKTNGSWLQTLFDSGVIDKAEWDTGYGVRCIAKDGHECLSLAERMIDDWMHSKGIKHDKEPHYPKDPELNPEGNMRADWIIKKTGAYVEYFGMRGKDDYDAKTEVKKKLCKKLGIKLIALYQEDLLELPSKIRI